MLTPLQRGRDIEEQDPPLYCTDEFRIYYMKVCPAFLPHSSYGMTPEFWAAKPGGGAVRCQ